MGVLFHIVPCFPIPLAVPGKWFRHLPALLLRLFILVAPPLAAQSAPHPAFRQYNTDDGLSSSEIYGILQDREGYIWISSDNGVSRFDGYGFRNYSVKDGLLENVIFRMQLDTAGRVWMQAMGGNLYYLDGDTILPYWNNPVLEAYKGSSDVYPGFIVEGAGETVHVAAWGYGVLSISKDGRVKTYPHSEPESVQVFEKNGKAILSAIMIKSDLESFKLHQGKSRDQNYSSPVYFYVPGAVWTFPEKFYSRVGRQFEAFLLAPGQYLLKIADEVWYIKNGSVRWQRHFPQVIDHAGLMANGQLWLGLYGHQGLQVYPSVDAFRKTEASAWLSGESVSYFLEDRDGGLWVATNKNGVFYTPADALRVYDRATGLPTENATALSIKNDRELFVGLGNGNIWQLDWQREQWHQLPPLFPAAEFIKDLHYDRSTQRLWATNSSLYFFQNGQWLRKDVSYQHRLLSFGNRIAESPNGSRLWVSGHIGFMGLDGADPAPGNIQIGYNQRTYAVREDYAGRVWLGRPKGLFEWKNGALHERQNLHPAFSLRVEALALMPDSSLVVATKGGGIVFWKGAQFEQLTTDQGLCADMLECLHVDARGVVWAGTLNGLNRISGSWGNRQVEQITVAHGLPSNEINGIRTAGETVWVATSKGLVRFFSKKNNAFSPKPILESALTNNQAVDLSRAVRLRPHQNNLRINFLALNFKMNGQIRYRYRLDGSLWTQTPNRAVNYAELPPGKRLFEVQAQNEDGVWSASTALAFTIEPPWWATWWARAGAFVAAFLLVFGLYQYRTGQLKKENRTQRQIAELERAALQAQMNPHFIFNCLNSIQNFILQNEQAAAIQYLGR
ncbi:MAG: histidine kinase, partial [Saprospiraceae bacterium]|nr:histidine kinase [Saprospiraceae bacterium]